MRPKAVEVSEIGGVAALGGIAGGSPGLLEACGDWYDTSEDGTGEIPAFGEGKVGDPELPEIGGEGLGVGGWGLDRFGCHLVIGNDNTEVLLVPGLAVGDEAPLEVGALAFGEHFFEEELAEARVAEDVAALLTTVADDEAG